MNHKRTNGWAKHLDFLLLDLAAEELAYLVAFYLRHHNWNLQLYGGLYVQMNYFLLALELCYCVLRSEHKNILQRSAAREIEQIILNNGILWGGLMVILYASKMAFWFSRTVFLTGLGLGIGFMLAARLSWKAILRAHMRRSKTQSYTLIIAEEAAAREMTARLMERPYSGLHLQGIAVVDRDMKGTEIEGVPVVCGAEDLLSYVTAHTVDEVMVSLSAASEARTDLVDALIGMGVTVHVCLDFNLQDLPNHYLERIGGFSFLTTSINAVSGFPLAVKRLGDILFGIIGCAVTGIAYLFVAPAIKRASPGPVFFTQTRVGKNGRKFKMYKFRSMYMDAEARKAELMKQNKMQGMMFKIDNDPRIIGSEKGPGKGIGNFIRKTSIDELPQFLNILKGDMSLVGTRPPTVDEFEQYSPHHKVRLSMKPGLTGMWQVSGRSDITDFEEIVRLDESYIMNWSIGLDFKIIFKTIGVVLKHEGAE